MKIYYLFLLFCTTINIYPQMVGGIDTAAANPLFSKKNTLLDCNIQFEFEPIQNNLVGLTFDGTYLYTIKLSQPFIYKYTLSGQPAGSIPYPVVANPALICGGLDFDGTNLILMEEQQGVLYKLNPSNGAIVSSFNIVNNSGDPNYMACAHESGKIWVISYYNPRELRCIDEMTGALISAFPLSLPYYAAKIINGDLYCITGGSGTKYLQKINKTNGSVLSEEVWCLNSTYGMTIANNQIWALNRPTSGPDKIVQFSNMLSIDDFARKTSDIRIFPNPANNYINVLSDENIKSLTMFDVSGKCIYRDNSFNLSSASIDISNFSKGMYLIKITTNKGTFDEKYIKL